MTINELADFAAGSAPEWNPKHTRSAAILRALSGVTLPDWVTVTHLPGAKKVTLSTGDDKLELFSHVVSGQVRMYAHRNGYHICDISERSVARVISEWVKIEAEDRRREKPQIQAGWSSSLGGGGFALVR